MSLNGIVDLNRTLNLDSLVVKNYIEPDNEKLIKVLEEGLKEISGRLYSIEVTIENKNDLKK